MDLDLAVGNCFGLALDTEGDIPPELVVDTYHGRGPDTGGGTPPEVVPGTALRSFEDMEAAHMAACTVDH
jgi:hypothetical protein